MLLETQETGRNPAAMTKEKALIQKGKRLSYLLRHDQSYTFDAHGYREVSDLIQNHGYIME